VHGRARSDGRLVVLKDATRLEGDIVIWACGPWLAELFPDLVSLSVTCQELLFFDGGPAWRAPGIPSWCDYDRARYGTADIDMLGVKAAIDDEGPPLHPDAALSRRSDHRTAGARQPARLTRRASDCSVVPLDVDRASRTRIEIDAAARAQRRP